MHRVRKHLTPSTAIAFIALIFAITGASFAATGAGSGGGGGNTHSFTASASKAKPKTKAGPRGPAGPKGATGATGATGAAGATGPGGPQGTAGANGTNGTNGEKGTTGATGPEGPVGPEGPTGPAGVIHPGLTLPSEASETGMWSITIPKGLGFLGGASAGLSPISFAVPLATTLSATNVKVEPEDYEGTEPQCPNDTKKEREEEELAQEKPQVAKAAPGFLCVYTDENPGELIKPEAHEGNITPNGVVLTAISTEEGYYAQGTWAVTAP
jgi:hypothetical protein